MDQPTLQTFIQRAGSKDDINRSILVELMVNRKVLG
jgi:hypothetical protein